MPTFRLNKELHDRLILNIVQFPRSFTLFMEEIADAVAERRTPSYFYGCQSTEGNNMVDPCPGTLLMRDILCTLPENMNAIHSFTIKTQHATLPENTRTQFIVLP